MEKRFEEILSKAIRSKSTDVHFNIVENRIDIRIRTIKGLVNIEGRSEDMNLFNWLLYLSHLDPSTYNKPQSGSFTYYFRGIYYDFRFSVVNTVSGKNAVLRILNCQKGLKLNELTVIEEDQNSLAELLTLKGGLVIFTGTTGQGKTTTMYSLLSMMKNRTVFSIEDPIEVKINSMVQIQVNEKINLSYDQAIAQVLRHNPEVIMIGEIRDEKTAKMAVRAALTGCLVFTSMHCKTSVSALQRLIQLGVDRDDLLAGLSAISNQRLVKCCGKYRYSCIYEFLNEEQIRSILLGNREIKSYLDEKISNYVKAGVIECESV